ncbi:YueH family protein [Brevibacillus sp. NPDC003359]|uniref:YueH family protein n=1 Tax=unclassified Brevibacillus TaxID=2684853 RepID=UPI0036875CE3
MDFKVKTVILGQVTKQSCNVYIQRVNEEKADVVSIPSLEWSTIIPDDEGIGSIQELEELHERICKSLERSLFFRDADILAEKILRWVTHHDD